MLSYRPFNSAMEPFCLEKVIHDLGCRVSSFHKITDESCYQLKHSAIYFIFLSRETSVFYVSASDSMSMELYAYICMNIMHVV